MSIACLLLPCHCSAALSSYRRFLGDEWREEKEGDTRMRLIKIRTPWLTTRRRTCPICKGDVVRSLQRANGSTSPRYTPYEEDQSEDEQERTAMARNDSPSAERPLSPHGDEDVEQGVRPPTPRRDNTSGSWLSNFAQRVGLMSPTPPPQEDRRRD